MGNHVNTWGRTFRQREVHCVPSEFGDQLGPVRLKPRLPGCVSEWNGGEKQIVLFGGHLRTLVFTSLPAYYHLFIFL